MISFLYVSFDRSLIVQKLVEDYQKLSEDKQRLSESVDTTFIKVKQLRERRDQHDTLYAAFNNISTHSEELKARLADEEKRSTSLTFDLSILKSNYTTQGRRTSALRARS
jgi:hypothetical protein